MLVGALVGGAIAAASSIATQAASGKSIDWGQVGKEAAVGAVAGAVCALVGPEAGPLVRADVDTAVAVGSQVATNALNGKPLGDGVLMAGAIGLASSVGMGAAVKVGGKVLSKVLGRAAEAAESEVAESSVTALSRWLRTSSHNCHTFKFPPVAR